jgi:membrane protease YdiL (CAAX protease family)
MMEMIETNNVEQESTNNTGRMKRSNQIVMVILPVYAIITAELLLLLGRLEFAIWMHVIILISMALIMIRSNEINIHWIYQALMLLSLLRLVNISMPIFFEMTLYTFVFVYAPLIIPVYFLIVHQKFTADQIGLRRKNIMIYIPIAIILGLMIAEGEYYLIQPGYLIYDLSLWNILKLSVVMILFVGLVEELIFRSVLQTRLEEFFGMYSGLVMTSMLFGIMHSGYGTVYEMMFTGLAGVVIGYLFQKTRSLPLIALLHGIVNIFLFGLIPHLGPMFGLY